MKNPLIVYQYYQYPRTRLLKSGKQKGRNSASLSRAGSKTQTPQANRRSTTIVGPLSRQPFARSIMWTLLERINSTFGMGLSVFDDTVFVLIDFNNKFSASKHLFKCDMFLRKSSAGNYGVFGLLLYSSGSTSGWVG